MDLLRIATAGSVDDGKSTLIGRLLYETNSITTDKLEAIERASQRKGINFTDLSLLTDGLIAEREQGITIDVAHIYFNTPKRKFIIADSPGHIEYTRNMITGASKADVSLILVDARNGIMEQTHRHYYIANLLQIKKVMVCINKMDLVQFSEETYNKIKSDFLQFAERIKNTDQSIEFVPISSLFGENITTPSERMTWYTGEPLLALLESMEGHSDVSQKPARFPVQYVVRPRSDEYHDFRGYAGRVSSGTFKVGDEVVSLPSLQQSTIEKIHQYDQSLSEANATQSIVFTLKDNIDISRGDMLVKKSEQPDLKKDVQADVCWINAQPLVPGKTYLMLHGTVQSKVKVAQVDYVQHPSTLEKTQANVLKLNDIASVQLRSAKNLAIDSFIANKANGSFILVDEHSNNTVAVGLVKG
jgi:sulfate adenylyltransferase, large subunit